MEEKFAGSTKAITIKVIGFLIVISLIVVFIVIRFPKTFMPPKTLDKVAEYNNAEILKYGELYFFPTTRKYSEGRRAGSLVPGTLTFLETQRVVEYKAIDTTYTNVLKVRVAANGDEVEDWLPSAGLYGYDAKGKGYGDFAYAIYLYPEFIDIIFVSEQPMAKLRYFVLSGFAFEYSQTRSVAFAA